MINRLAVAVIVAAGLCFAYTRLAHADIFWWIWR